jgi:CHAD domain-containing protein
MAMPDRILRNARPVYSLHDALAVLLQKVVSQFKPDAPDNRIHEVRKDLKRIRAALRLLRDAVGANEYRRSNRAIRDAAQPLTPIRDAAVLAKTFKTLAMREASRRGIRCARQLQGELKKERQVSRQCLTAGAIQRSVYLLNQVMQRIEASPIRQPDAVSIIRGLTRVYRRGGKAMRRAKHKAGDDRLHEWRKQTKYFLNELTLVKSLLHVKTKRERKRSRRLADTLGDDHDLALLKETMRAFRRLGQLSSKAHNRWMKRIKVRRQVLQGNAFRLGHRLYTKSAREFEAKLHRAVEAQ